MERIFEVIVMNKFLKKPGTYLVLYRKIVAVRCDLQANEAE